MWSDRLPQLEPCLPCLSVSPPCCLWHTYSLGRPRERYFSDYFAFPGLNLHHLNNFAIILLTIKVDKSGTCQMKERNAVLIIMPPTPVCPRCVSVEYLSFSLVFHSLWSLPYHPSFIIASHQLQTLLIPSFSMQLILKFRLFLKVIKLNFELYEVWQTRRIKIWINIS